MNENLNLVEILKDCPEGTKLYSTVFGEVEFKSINEDNFHPIIVKLDNNHSYSFAADGRVCNFYKGECTLFPSREERNWSKFKQLVKPKFKVGDKIVHSLGKKMGAKGSQGVISEITYDKYIFTDTSYAFIRNQDSWELVPDKKPKFDPKKLQPFDKILARNGHSENWNCDIFSNINDNEPYKYNTISNYWKYCIPYNKETKHLVGTKDEAPEFYRYWED